MLIVLGLWVAVMVFVIWLGWPDDVLRALMILGPIGPLLYVFGASTSVAVTPREVVVSNVFHRWRIARDLIVYPNPDKPNDTFIDVTGHEPVDVSALQTAIERRTVVEALRWFRAAMAEVVPLGGDGRRRLRVRWINVLVVAGSIGGWGLSENYLP